MQDGSATLALLHRDKPAHACYGDWLELTRLAPVLGRWTTLSAYLEAVTPGEYLSPGTPDDFRGDYLVERSPSTAPGHPANHEPVSSFARQLRARRRLDAALTLEALYRGLGGKSAPPGGEALPALEDRLESEGVAGEELDAALQRSAATLATRLVARGEPGRPGFLVLNPCGFKRRVALELPDAPPPGGPVKASQAGGAGSLAVVEVPALGFAWVPRSADGPAPAAPRLRLADQHTVRNEFFEAEIDPATGGLRSLRDARTRVGRLGQQLVFNPGSAMRAREVKVTAAGPALGEVVSEGVLVDAQEGVLASFRQRFRAWVGRPVLELRVELRPARPPQGYPWHAYFGARFAWRDERASLVRGCLGTAYVTGHTRPETPDFLEVRQGREATAIFPGGLPFHQRAGGRMVDVILATEGEAAQAFELGVALDRDYPMQTALGLPTPSPAVPVDRGPPPVGAAGWLFHLDAPNLMLTALRPDPGGADAVTARLLECGFAGGQAGLRCPRDPRRALLLDARGEALSDLPVEGDTVQLDVRRNELAHVRVEFG